jgi:hypothetical protein
MSADEHLATYAEGWTKGDTDIIFKVLTESYVYDDPDAGRIAKHDFQEYMAGFKDKVASLRGGKPEPQFMELSEVVTQEAEGVITAWCWWAVPGTDIEGSGLIKVGLEGVLSERITYYTKLPG